MIDGFIVIILVMLGCIGLGVLLGWVLWGDDMKYYKNLYKICRKNLKSTDENEALLEQRGKDVLNKLHENHKHYNRSIVMADYDD